jgi:hypothetical protein
MFSLKGLVPLYPHFRWAVGLTHEVASLLLLVYVLSRRNLRLASLGFRWSAKDLLLGVTIAIGSYIAYAIGFFLRRMSTEPSPLVKKQRWGSG